MKKYLHMATFYLVMGLVAGVFYREFTKMSGFEGKTLLSVSHTHILILGFFMAILLLLLEKNFKFSTVKSAKAWFVVYNCSFVYMVAMFITRGIMQVLGTSMAGLNHIAGLAHFLVGGSLIWFVVLCYKMIENNVRE